MWQDKKYQFITLYIHLYEDHLDWDEVGFAGRQFTLYYTDIISVSGGNSGRILGGTSRFEINTAGQTYKYNSTLGEFIGLEECIQIINERIQFFRKKDSTVQLARTANSININPENIEPTITRIEIFLEDGEWDNVTAYANAALDYFPTDYRLYKYLLLADMKCKSIGDLKDCGVVFNTNSNYKKLDRFADEPLKKELKDILEYIAYEPVYLRALNITDKEKALELFKTIRGYKDSDDYIASLKAGIKKDEEQKQESAENLRESKYQAAIQLQNRAETIDDYKRALDALEDLNAITNDSNIKRHYDVVNRQKEVQKKYDELVREKEYSDAVEGLSSGEVSKIKTAKSTFDKYKDYKDCNIKSKEAQSIIAAADKQRKRIITIVACVALALILFITVVLPMMNRNSLVQKYGESTVEVVSGLKVGDTFTLGSYEQDNDDSNGKEAIEWLVLDKNGDGILAVSVYQLDLRTFHTEHAEVTWETCELRKWLNNDFFNEAFTAVEQELIPELTVSADENPEYSTDPGNETMDRVFLLSVPEVNRYLAPDYGCYATDYVESVWHSTWWWLRSPGGDSFSHALADCYDNRIAYNPCLQKGGIRPAIRVKLN